MIRLFNPVAAAFLALLAAAPAAAEPRTYRGEYALSYLGLTFARIDVESRVDSDSYSIEGSVSSAGVAQLFDDTRGTLLAKGRFSDGVTRPDHFRADYVSGDKAAVVDIRFDAGDVIETTNIPPLKKRGKNWEPLDAGDLESVADPIAATLIPAGSIGEVCGRRTRLYDGEMRADLTLDQASTGGAPASGQWGETVTCRLRFDPVAGYRKGRKSLEFLRTKSRIMVTFAQLGQTGIYAPVHATVGTEIGTITIRARRLETL